MATTLIKISQLPLLEDSVLPESVLPIVQSGTTYKVPVSSLGGGGPAEAWGVIGADGSIHPGSKGVASVQWSCIVGGVYLILFTPSLFSVLYPPVVLVTVDHSSITDSFLSGNIRAPYLIASDQWAVEVDIGFWNSFSSSWAGRDAPFMLHATQRTPD